MPVTIVAASSVLVCCPWQLGASQYLGAPHTIVCAVPQALTLRSAMNIFFKMKNFATCAMFCRRLLELNPGAKVRTAL